MAMFATGSFLLNNSTGNQLVTGVGFEPRVVIFFSGQKIDAQGNQNNGSYMMGAAVNPVNQWGVSGDCRGYAGVNNSSSMYFLSTACMTSIKGGNSDTVTFVSFNADGFRVNVVSTFGEIDRIFYIAIGGSDVNANVGTITPSGTGDKVFTGVGFKPDLLIFGGWATTGTSATSNQANSIGFANVSSQARLAFCCKNGDPVLTTTTNSSQLSSDCCVGNIWTSGDDSRASFVSMDTDGFTLNYSSDGGGYHTGYVALRGIKSYIGVFTENTTTGNQAISGIGFKPELLLFISQSLAADTALHDDATSWMIGMAINSINRRVFTTNSPSTVATVQSQSRTSEALCLTHVLGTATTADATHPTVLAEAEFVSRDTDGFTINMTTADATAREVRYLALASEPRLNTIKNTLRPRAFAPGVAR